MSDEEIKKAKYKSLIDSYFIDDPKYSRYSFKGMMENTISSVIQKFFEIVTYYFDKYPEAYFHQRMQDQYVLIDKKTNERFICKGFDFVGDWKRFHKAKFITSITVMKANKHWFKFDENRMSKVMIGLLQAKGWDISEYEKESIHQTIRRMKNIIYHSRDSLLDLDKI